MRMSDTFQTTGVQLRERPFLFLTNLFSIWQIFYHSSKNLSDSSLTECKSSDL